MVIPETYLDLRVLTSVDHHLGCWTKVGYEALHLYGVVAKRKRLNPVLITEPLLERRVGCHEYSLRSFQE